MPEWWGIVAAVSVAVAASAVAVYYYSDDDWYESDTCYETIDLYRDEVDWVKEDARSQENKADEWVSHIYNVVQSLNTTDRRMLRRGLEYKEYGDYTYGAYNSTDNVITTTMMDYDYDYDYYKIDDVDEYSTTDRYGQALGEFDCWSKHWSKMLNDDDEQKALERMMDSEEDFKKSGLWYYCSDVTEYEFYPSSWDVYKPGGAWDESYDCIYDSEVLDLSVELEAAHEEYLFWTNFCDWAEAQYDEYYKEIDQNPQDAPNYYDGDYGPYYGYDYGYGYDDEEDNDEKDSTYYSGMDDGDSKEDMDDYDYSDYLKEDKEAEEEAEDETDEAKEAMSDADAEFAKAMEEFNKAIEEMNAGFEDLDFDNMDFDMDD